MKGQQLSHRVLRMPTHVWEHRTGQRRGKAPNPIAPKNKVRPSLVARKQYVRDRRRRGCKRSLFEAARDRLRDLTAILPSNVAAVSVGVFLGWVTAVMVSCATQ